MNNDLKIVGEVIYFQGYRVADLLSSVSVPASVMETFKDYIYDLGEPEEEEGSNYDAGYDAGYAAGLSDGEDEGYNMAMAEMGPKNSKPTNATPAGGSVSVSANSPED